MSEHDNFKKLLELDEEKLSLWKYCMVLFYFRKSKKKYILKLCELTYGRDSTTFKKVRI